MSIECILQPDYDSDSAPQATHIVLISRLMEAQFTKTEDMIEMIGNWKKTGSKDIYFPKDKMWKIPMAVKQMVM